MNPLEAPTRLACPVRFMVLTFSTLTPNRVSTAFPISILFAFFATLKYTFC
jgi:hypothetical protein